METRKRLMRAAMGMFFEKGVDATTIEDITERADLGKGTFYRHFQSKGEVLSALIQNAVGDLVQHMRKSASSQPDLQEMLRALLNAHTTFFLSNTEQFLVLFQGNMLVRLQREESAQLEPPLVEYLIELEQRIAPLVGPGLSHGKIRRLACGLAGFVSGFLSFRMVNMTPEEIERILEPLRQAFVSASSGFLTGRSAVVPA